MIILLIKLVFNDIVIGEVDTFEYDYVNGNIIVTGKPDLIYRSGFE